MGSLKQFIICSTSSIIKWEHQKKENTILPRLNSLLHTTEHGVIWGNRVGRGNIRRNNGRFCVFSFLYLQDLFIHSNCLESTYCELTEICINSTLRSVTVIYCWVINYIKICGLKQQRVIFSQVLWVD